ncbi:hypothetical protein DFJ73DRAFT_961603 [Zopfochytrium polystomum]|nr:hypothetical protein DFJ73DRAFT_961603 [Zopfochytrium polystomum]
MATFYYPPAGASQNAFSRLPLPPLPPPPVQPSSPAWPKHSHEHRQKLYQPHQTQTGGFFPQKQLELQQLQQHQEQQQRQQYLSAPAQPQPDLSPALAAPSDLDGSNLVEAFHCVRLRLGGRTELQWSRSIGKMLSTPAPESLSDEILATVTASPLAQPSTPTSPTTSSLSSSSSSSPREPFPTQVHHSGGAALATADVPLAAHPASPPRTTAKKPATALPVELRGFNSHVVQQMTASAGPLSPPSAHPRGGSAFAASVALGRSGSSASHNSTRSTAGAAAAAGGTAQSTPPPPPPPGMRARAQSSAGAQMARGARSTALPPSAMGFIPLDAVNDASSGIALARSVDGSRRGRSGSVSSLASGGGGRTATAGAQAAAAAAAATTSSSSQLPAELHAAVAANARNWGDGTIAFRLRVQRASAATTEAAASSAAAANAAVKAASPLSPQIPSSALADTPSSTASTLVNSSGSSAAGAVSPSQPTPPPPIVPSSVAATIVPVAVATVPVRLAEVPALCLRARAFRLLLAQHCSTLRDLSDSLAGLASPTSPAKSPDGSGGRAGGGGGGFGGVSGAPASPTAYEAAWDAASLSTAVTSSFLPPTVNLVLPQASASIVTAFDGTARTCTGTTVMTMVPALPQPVPLLVAYALGYFDDDAAYASAGGGGGSSRAAPQQQEQQQQKQQHQHHQRLAAALHRALDSHIAQAVRAESVRKGSTAGTADAILTLVRDARRLGVHPLFWAVLASWLAPRFDAVFGPGGGGSSGGWSLPQWRRDAPEALVLAVAVVARRAGWRQREVRVIAAWSGIASAGGGSHHGGAGAGSGAVASIEAARSVAVGLARRVDRIVGGAMSVDLYDDGDGDDDDGGRDGHARFQQGVGPASLAAGADGISLAMMAPQRAASKPKIFGGEPWAPSSSSAGGGGGSTAAEVAVGVSSGSRSRTPSPPLLRAPSFASTLSSASTLSLESHDDQSAPYDDDGIPPPPRHPPPPPPTAALPPRPATSARPPAPLRSTSLDVSSPPQEHPRRLREPHCTPDSGVGGFDRSPAASSASTAASPPSRRASLGGDPVDDAADDDADDDTQQDPADADAAPVPLFQLSHIAAAASAAAAASTTAATTTVAAAVGQTTPAPTLAPDHRLHHHQYHPRDDTDAISVVSTATPYYRYAATQRQRRRRQRLASGGGEDEYGSDASDDDDFDNVCGGDGVGAERRGHGLHPKKLSAPPRRDADEASVFTMRTVNSLLARYLTPADDEDHWWEDGDGGVGDGGGSGSDGSAVDGDGDDDAEADGAGGRPAAATAAARRRRPLQMRRGARFFAPLPPAVTSGFGGPGGARGVTGVVAAAALAAGGGGLDLLLSGGDAAVAAAMTAFAAWRAEAEAGRVAAWAVHAPRAEARFAKLTVARRAGAFAGLHEEDGDGSGSGGRMGAGRLRRILGSVSGGAASSAAAAAAAVAAKKAGGDSGGVLEWDVMGGSVVGRGSRGGFAMQFSESETLVASVVVVRDGRGRVVNTMVYPKRL